jgi:hypothetical protein
MLRLLNSDSAIVAVVDHGDSAAGWQPVQCPLILDVPCGRREIADGRLALIVVTQDVISRAIRLRNLISAGLTQSQTVDLKLITTRY